MESKTLEIFLEGKSIVDKFISQFRCRKKEESNFLRGNNRNNSPSWWTRSGSFRGEFFSRSLSGRPRFSAKSIFVDGRQNSGEEGITRNYGGEWIVQFYVMENGGVGATFNRLRLLATLDIRFVAATFKLLPCLPFFFNALSPSLELGHK